MANDDAGESVKQERTVGLADKSPTEPFATALFADDHWPALTARVIVQFQKPLTQIRKKITAMKPKIQIADRHAWIMISVACS